MVDVDSHVVGDVDVEVDVDVNIDVDVDITWTSSLSFWMRPKVLNDNSSFFVKCCRPRRGSGMLGC